MSYRKGRSHCYLKFFDFFFDHVGKILILSLGLMTYLFMDTDIKITEKLFLIFVLGTSTWAIFLGAITASDVLVAGIIDVWRNR